MAGQLRLNVSKCHIMVWKSSAIFEWLWRFNLVIRRETFWSFVVKTHGYKTLGNWRHPVSKFSLPDRYLYMNMKWLYINLCSMLFNPQLTHTTARKQKRCKFRNISFNQRYANQVFPKYGAFAVGSVWLGFRNEKVTWSSWHRKESYINKKIINKNKSLALWDWHVLTVLKVPCHL